MTKQIINFGKKNEPATKASIYLIFYWFNDVT